MLIHIALLRVRFAKNFMPSPEKLMYPKSNLSFEFT
jgi:hypothetical protein